ncbi:MAG: hypothetical protein J5725_01940 [Bacteroidales bacterium]|nr:hypothetical protein [Bacteroidales bacterium]
MEYVVQCTKILNGSMVVEAESESEALEIVQDKLNNDVDCVDWDFGEATADYAEVE